MTSELSSVLNPLIARVSELSDGELQAFADVLDDADAEAAR